MKTKVQVSKEAKVRGDWALTVSSILCMLPPSSQHLGLVLFEWESHTTDSVYLIKRLPSGFKYQPPDPPPWRRGQMSISVDNELWSSLLCPIWTLSPWLRLGSFLLQSHFVSRLSLFATLNNNKKCRMKFRNLGQGHTLEWFSNTRCSADRSEVQGWRTASVEAGEGSRGIRGVGIGVRTCFTFCNLQSLGWEGEAERRASSPSTLHTTGLEGGGEEESKWRGSSALPDDQEGGEEGRDLYEPNRVYWWVSPSQWLFTGPVSPYQSRKVNLLQNNTLGSLKIYFWNPKLTLNPECYVF